MLLQEVNVRYSRIPLAVASAIACLGLSACASGAFDGVPNEGTADALPGTGTPAAAVSTENVGMNRAGDGYADGVIPPQLEMVPDSYREPAREQGVLERLDYDTYESFSYESRSQLLHKTAWVYVPYGYDPGKEYDILYLSHGGWSNETTLMGTDAKPTAFKNVVDNAIADGQVKPLIMVMPTYNNTSPEDSSDYSLALQLTDNFHNELTNDLIPAVESRYSSYAQDTTPEGLRASRDHRAFGGFSMGGVNTWRTFQYCLGYFHDFVPMSGGVGFSGDRMAQLVRDQGFGSEDFFIFAMTGTDDFAHDGFSWQIDELVSSSDGVFLLGDSRNDANLAYREHEGYSHNSIAAEEYTYNGLRFLFGR